jgi:hypothetical protein
MIPSRRPKVMLQMNPQQNNETTGKEPQISAAVAGRASAVGQEETIFNRDCL